MNRKSFILSLIVLLTCTITLSSFCPAPPLPTITTVKINGNDDAAYGYYAIKVEFSGIEYYTQQSATSTDETTGPRDPEWFPADFMHRASYVAKAKVWVKYNSSLPWSYQGEVLSTDNGVTNSIANGKLYTMEFHLDIFLNP